MAAGLTNLSLAPGTTSACIACNIGIDSRASTSSVTLMRDFGDISDTECKRYDTDLAAVKNREMSFQDFFTKLQSGSYSRPASKNSKGEEFCEQIKFSDEDAAKIKTLSHFTTNVGLLDVIRIRRVTSGGSFSSGTKAKFKMSIPLKLTYVAELEKGGTPTTRLTGFPPRWETVPGPQTQTPVLQSTTVSMMTMYHPSPLRVENVQHDAILSLNDPSDPDATVVVLVPLKASNTGDESVDFFEKLAKHLTTISAPDSVTGLYPETTIPTGNDWGINRIFWLDEAGSDNVAPITDGFFTWTGAASFKRVETSRSATEIKYGWQREGKQVRYFMLQNPVSISSTDLSFLTRSLPPTPPTEAIHTIPDPAVAGVPKVLYKQATGPAVSAGCGVVRERMTNQSQGDVLASRFLGSGTQDLFVDEKGVPLSDKETCDPFKNNASRVLKNPSPFSPIKATAFLFNVLMLIAVAFGAWIGLFFVVNKDYDLSFQNFSTDTGKVLGTLAMQTSGRIKDTAYSVAPSLPSVPSLSGLLGKKLPV